MVVLFGILALVAQFFYWAAIVKGLNDQLVEAADTETSIGRRNLLCPADSGPRRVFCL